MSSEIIKDFTFLSCVHFEQKFIANLYEMSASMIVETDNVHEQNVAIERMGYYLNSYLDDSVFICEKEKEAIEKYQNAGIKTCIIPEEPYDQIVGMIIMNKCNAIMEDRLIIEDIVFGSKLSNLVRFKIDIETAINEYPGKFWYNSPALSCEKKKTKNKIVSLFGNNTWEELNLTWKVK